VPNCTAGFVAIRVSEPSVLHLVQKGREFHGYGLPIVQLYRARTAAFTAAESPSKFGRKFSLIVTPANGLTRSTSSTSSTSARVNATSAISSSASAASPKGARVTLGQRATDHGPRGEHLPNSRGDVRHRILRDRPVERCDDDRHGTGESADRRIRHQSGIAKVQHGPGGNRGRQRRDGDRLVARICTRRGDCHHDSGLQGKRGRVELCTAGDELFPSKGITQKRRRREFVPVERLIAAHWLTGSVAVNRLTTPRKLNGIVQGVAFCLARSLGVM
jgi:hypothetical protein